MARQVAYPVGIMSKLNSKNLSIVVCIAAVLYVLTVATTSNAQSKNDKKETSVSTQKPSTAVAASDSKVLKNTATQTNDKDVKIKKDNKKALASTISAGSVAKKPLDLDTAAGEKKYMLVKKKPKMKKIKMEVYKPKMKYKKIKMKVPVKKMKKKKVKGYMVKKKHHY